MLKFLLWIWQLPQNLVGWIYLKTLKQVYKRTWESSDLGRIGYYDVFRNGSVSLGNYIFIAWSRPETIRHEYGHQRQSRYLGPLYLLLIGLPSFCGYWWDVWFHETWSFDRAEQWYYNLPWEKWADRLGHVKRFYAA